MKLLLNALTKLIFGMLLLAMLIFLPAGTFSYPDGWLFMGILFIPMIIFGAFLFVKAPDLLKKRLDHKEKERTQRRVVALSALIFVLGFITAGLDFRFDLSSVPRAVTVIASLLFLLSYCLYGEVMRENAYLSRTVKVEENQRVVDTGLYAIVRHPMYMATILMFLSMPLVLGSFISFIIFLFYPLLIAVRIKSEEKLLEEKLEGYKEYKKKVRYKILPFIF